ncbi:MAG: hypothetical protein K0Q50_1083 [Vampirovibrio sp.]|jgi:hypothetical protein|nr:hypothetical protein [Vampirovibrio sp.]
MYGVECLNLTMSQKMAQRAFDNRKPKPTALLSPRDEQRMPPLHQYYVPNFKSKSKSRAASYNMEFLSRVFASDGASRFFKTFLLRFLFDSGSKSSDDCSAMLMLSPAL